MDAIAAFVRNIPEAASSPLAFFAYFLVVAAWALRTWLYINPTRDARQILAQYTDDTARNVALAKLFNEQPPHGLKGNEAILDWVRNRSAEKTRVLWVVAWLATLIAVLAFLVAIRNTRTENDAREISVSLHRSGSVGDCPSLPIPSHLRIVSSSGKRLSVVGVVGGCGSTIVVPRAAHGLVKVELEDAGPYELTKPTEMYELAAANWHVDVSQSAGARLLISMFSYAGSCDQRENAFATFREILRSKTTSVRGMFPADDKRYDYLLGMNVYSVGKALEMSAGEVRSYWQQTGSLQVLSGLCFIREGEDIMRSQIFSGPLAGSLPEPLLAELPISAEEFGATRDIHTVSILYALAQEAQSRKLDRDIVIAYLAMARAIDSQIRVSPAGQMKQAIDQALQNAGAPVPMEHAR
jgi:hypothetical protein